MSKKFIRKFTEEERVEIVKEVLECGSNALIAGKYDIHKGLISNWKCNYVRYKQTLKPKESKEVSDEEQIVNYKREYKKSEEKCKDLELEVAILRDLLKKN